LLIFDQLQCRDEKNKKPLKFTLLIVFLVCWLAFNLQMTLYNQTVNRMETQSAQQSLHIFRSLFFPSTNVSSSQNAKIRNSNTLHTVLLIQTLLFFGSGTDMDQLQVSGTNITHNGGRHADLSNRGLQKYSCKTSHVQSPLKIPGI
jgi:hypothetical protein